MTPQSRTRPTLRHTGFVLLVAAGVLQVGTGIAADREYLARVPARWLDEPVDPRHAVQASVRILPELAKRIPAGCRVLVVTPVLDRIPFDFYFLHHDLRRMQVLREEWLPLIAERDPCAGWVAETMRGRLAERGELWSPGALQEALRDTDYVVAYMLDPHVLAGAALRKVAQLENATLYAVP